MNLRTNLTSLLLILFLLPATLNSQDVLSPDELLGIKSCSNLQLSPDGKHLIYSISTPRGPNDEPGSSHSEYLLMTIKTRETVPLFPEGVSGSSPRWSPDGKHVGFLYKGEGDLRQVWSLPAGGGEMARLTDSESDVSSFRWHPGGSGIAYLAMTPESEKQKELKKRGYGFIYFEENLRNTNLYIAETGADQSTIKTRQITHDGNVWDFEFNGQGTQIAAGISPENLVDHRYMFKRINLVDLGSGEVKKVSRNEGKLGNYEFSPDGKRLAYTAALNLNDHAVSQVFVLKLTDGELSNLTPEGLKGHISWVSWKNDAEIMYYSGEGVWPKLSLVTVTGGERKVILDASESGIVFDTPEFTADLKTFIFSGSTPEDPENIYLWKGKKDPAKITDLNPWITGKSLGKQEPVRYEARDGQEIEGLLIHPVGYEPGQKYPLIVYVHGGPESHHSNEWLSRYSTPGQVMAGRGYLVLYLNYRASTGYGVEFALEGLEDPAGKEFDDVADGIEYLIREKGADRERVGLAGGSYGGYASAWFATYYTRYVKAVCMFVGISDLISKRGTTDIPYEELYVHSGKPLEEQWQMNLERSPIYWAHQSKTASLIYGGADDTRVHPSQSLELYRRMKMNGHPAVRLVQYPGEGHGNRKQPGRIDVLYRQMDWFDWYVRDLNPLDGPMPPLDISDKYGLDWDF